MGEWKPSERFGWPYEERVVLELPDHIQIRLTVTAAVLVHETNVNSITAREYIQSELDHALAAEVRKTRKMILSEK